MPSLPKPNALIKPNLKTRFHIDYLWWDRANDDLRTYLLSHLLPEQREKLSHASKDSTIDYIDAETGEVLRLSELELAIQEAASDPNFINQQTSTVDSVFRALLKNNNQPLTPEELADHTQRDPEVILKTLSGRQIYKGIRPIS